MEKPDNYDHKKLSQVVKYLRLSKQLTLFIVQTKFDIKCWICMICKSYGHADPYRWHNVTGLQSNLFTVHVTKINTKGSNKAELVEIRDLTGEVSWTTMFLDCQDYKIGKNIIFQNNKTHILVAQKMVEVIIQAQLTHGYMLFFHQRQDYKRRLDVVHCQMDEMNSDFYKAQFLETMEEVYLTQMHHLKSNPPLKTARISGACWSNNRTPKYES